MTFTPFPELDQTIGDWDGAECGLIKRTISFADCLLAVSTVTGVSVFDIKSPRRFQSLVKPRFMVCSLAKRHTELSNGQIGMRLGNRDNSTILSGVRKADAYFMNDPLFAWQYGEAEALL